MCFSLISRYFMHPSFVLILALALTACKTRPAMEIPEAVKPYKAEVVQGNFVSSEQVAALRAGMTRSQVKNILGTPLLTDVFHADRWDYVFTLKRQGAEPQSRKVTLFFTAASITFFVGSRVRAACWISSAPLARISADCAAKMPVIARAFPNSFVRAFRSPPDSGVGWCFGAILTSKRRPNSGCSLGHAKFRPAPVFFVSSGALLAGVVEQSLRESTRDSATSSCCATWNSFRRKIQRTFLASPRTP